MRNDEVSYDRPRRRSCSTRAEPRPIRMNALGGAHESPEARRSLEGVFHSFAHVYGVHGGGSDPEAGFILTKSCHFGQWKHWCECAFRYLVFRKSFGLNYAITSITYMEAPYHSVQIPDQRLPRSDPAGGQLPSGRGMSGLSEESPTTPGRRGMAAKRQKRGEGGSAPSSAETPLRRMGRRDDFR